MRDLLRRELLALSFYSEDGETEYQLVPYQACICVLGVLRLLDFGLCKNNLRE